MEKQIDVCGVYLSPLSDKIIDKIPVLIENVFSAKNGCTKQLMDLMRQ